MTAARRPGPGIAAWAALPERDRGLLLWLVHGDVVTAELAGLLAYGHRRIAQRRLARLVEYGLVTGFWAANLSDPAALEALDDRVLRAIPMLAGVAE